MTDLFSAAAACLAAASPEAKVSATFDTAAAFARGELPIDASSPAPEPIRMPGRPPTPRLVHPRDLPRRGFGSNEGRAAFIHAVAHIEFNAIDLAWDAVYRFRDMPDAYYADWVSVANDEARHFSMLRARLRELGHDYGDFDAHNGLWEMAEKTAHDGLSRMALVPRVLEARGLDVTPGMIVKLRGLGDDATADILEIILREEIAHVAAGSRWFRWWCRHGGIDPDIRFRQLLDEYARGSLHGPFNHEARIAAGFHALELEVLESIGGNHADRDHGRPPRSVIQSSEAARRERFQSNASNEDIENGRSMTGVVVKDSSGQVVRDAEPKHLPADAIPVLRPRLPTVDQLAPYLARIDQSRVYSNFGPLTAEFEQRLGEHFALDADCVVSAGSGYAALVGAILACTGRAKSQDCLAIVPAYTFVATAAAVEHCGYSLYLADIDAETWMLDPQRLLDEVDLDRVGVVVPVATLGRPVPVDAWRRFHERTGIAVVIDGAASFDALAHAPERYIDDAIPVVVSFHATKTFATGEGGCVLARDPALIARAARALNFGFLGSRDCGSASLNGKLSEYHAAVGLAEFDHWSDKQAAIHAVATGYRGAFHELGIGERFHGAPEVGGSYSVFHASNQAEAQRVCAALQADGIDFRFWYGQGLHRQPYYADAVHERLAVTETIAATLIGLPFAPDLDDASIARIVGRVHAGISGA